MKRIIIKLKFSDEEFDAIATIIQFIKMKYGLKKTFLNGLVSIIEKEIENEKLLEEIKKRIGML
ncbi:MAG: hypothetical protein J7K47_03585 [Thermoplasmata archaeon]|nr:hypothetical protein [Thermoplasmata archaeon]